MATQMVADDVEYFTAHAGALEMKRTGGDFMQALGNAFIKADLSNARRLFGAFRAEFLDYSARAALRNKLD